jgi:hypothetical protein
MSDCICRPSSILPLLFVAYHVEVHHHAGRVVLEDVAVHHP